MSNLVLLPEDMDAAGKQYLLERGYEICFCENCTSSITQAIGKCNAVIVRNARITRDILVKAPSLKVVARHGIGVDTIDLDCARELGIWVTNAPESNVNAVAEQVLGAIIACSRDLFLCDRLVRTGNYQRRTSVIGMELADKTLGVVGFGKIGHLVAQKAALGLGMKIVVFDPYYQTKTEAYPVKVVTKLEALLTVSDVVTLHMPLLPSTEKCIGPMQFHYMKPTAILINYARGQLVNTEALLEALKSKKIAGAALDVFDHEPIDREDPLCQMQQVLLSPHTAAFTRESLARMALHTAITVDEVLTGKTPRWFVVRGKLQKQ